MSSEEIPPSPMRKVARQLLAWEEAFGPTDDQAGKATRVFERLQIALARFAGAEGFGSLVRRAIALASAQYPSLRQLTVCADGSLEGLEQVSDDAALSLIEQFLSLLVAFVGEPLTLRLVGHAWPDAPLDQSKDTRSDR